MDQGDKERISNRFQAFADRECKGSSRLYEVLALRIAEDDELLGIAALAAPGQPAPNLFFGAVQYLLLKGKEHELKEYYLGMTESPREPEHAFDRFRDFCLLHRQEIVLILQSKRVQTNEVGRCAYLYPSFCRIFERVRKPLALLEIGTSAGLQLLWDRYSYSYGTDEIYGNSGSSVRIRSEITGDRKPLLLPASPPVHFRLGFDLHVNDLQHTEDCLWLKALIWPEHRERVVLFEKAARCIQDQQPVLVEGDGVQMLPVIAASVPRDTVICVFHTHVANQMTRDAKQLLLEHIREIGKTRDVFHLYNNVWDANLHLDFFVDGAEYKETLAETDGHGRWFRWMAEV